MDVKVKKVVEGAIVPQYKTEGAVGFDFHSTETVELHPPTLTKVPLEGDELTAVEDTYLEIVKASMGQSELDQVIDMLGENGLRAALLANVPEGTFSTFKVATHPVTVGTGLAMELPVGYELEMRGRSGLAFNNDVHVFNGTIDSDYRGEVHVRLYNLGSESITLEEGERVAQGIVTKVEIVNFIETEELSVTERGENRFGSTGTK